MFSIALAAALQSSRAQTNPPGFDCNYHIFDRNGAIGGAYEPFIVFFERHSAALTADARQVIELALHPYLPECRTLIQGTRDAGETEELALRRADTVAAYMRARGYSLPIRTAVAPYPPAQGEDAQQSWAREVIIGVEPMR